MEQYGMGGEGGDEGGGLAETDAHKTGVLPLSCRIL